MYNEGGIPSEPPYKTEGVNKKYKLPIKLGRQCLTMYVRRVSKIVSVFASPENIAKQSLMDINVKVMLNGSK